MTIFQTTSISSSWKSKEKSSEIDRDIGDPLFPANTDDDFQPFVDSDEGESSGMYSLIILKLEKQKKWWTGMLAWGRLHEVRKALMVDKWKSSDNNTFCELLNVNVTH